LHAPSEIGVDSFQADRSPTHMYRTAPLAGLWAHQKGGFYHDGRFATLLDVVNHYDAQFNLNLSDANKRDLIEYLGNLTLRVLSARTVSRFRRRARGSGNVV
jgi:hypothetical protein